jgi:glutathione S-transferase
MNAPAPVLRLHGYALSNYFNIARAALIEKGASFAVVETRASQTAAFLETSPMGKIPVLETPYGWLSETVAILDYIEDTVDGPRLHPSDPFLRARGRQVVNIVQLYVEAQIRSLFPGVFFGGTNSAATVGSVRQMLDRATGALSRLAVAEPFLLGNVVSYADLFAFYCLDIAERVTQFVYGRSILAEIGITEWFGRMTERDSSRIVLADFARVFPIYLVEKNAAYRPAWEVGSWSSATPSDIVR